MKRKNVFYLIFLINLLLTFYSFKLNSNLPNFDKNINDDLTIIADGNVLLIIKVITNNYSNIFNFIIL